MSSTTLQRLFVAASLAATLAFAGLVSYALSPPQESRRTAQAAGGAPPALPPDAPPIGTRPPTRAERSAAQQAGRARAGSAAVLELDWEELVPKESRLKFSAIPPAPIHDYLGEGGPPAQQVMDFSVNKELNGINAKLPGFIVPLDIGRDGLVTEFFLVPYFGACIHVPPPPPNQIVFVRSPRGIALDSIYDAYWITGRMTIQNKNTRLGAAAYQIVADKVEIYQY